MAYTTVDLPATGEPFYVDQISGDNIQAVKLIDGSSGSVVPIRATDEGNLRVNQGARTVATANISGADTVEVDTRGMGTVVIDWTGTYTGLTGTFNVDFGNGNWQTAHTFQIYDLTNNSHFVSFTSISSNRRIMVNCAGMAGLQMEVSAVSTGQVDVDITALPGVFPLPPAHQQITLYSLSARTATPAVSQISNYFNRTGVLHFYVSSAGTGDQTYTFEEQDRNSAQWLTLMSSGSITSTGLRSHLFDPTADPNLTAPDSPYTSVICAPLTRTMRGTITANNGNSMTSGMGLNALV